MAYIQLPVNSNNENLISKQYNGGSITVDQDTGEYSYAYGPSGWPAHEESNNSHLTIQQV